MFASNGSVVNNTASRTVTYTPVAGYTGPASFIYRVKDSAGAVSANTATVAITVVTPNTTPAAVNDGPFTVAQGASLTLTYGQLLGNDVDPDIAGGDVLSVNSVFASNGSVVNNTAARTVTYTPVANYTGPASFIYRVKDAAGAVSVNTAKVSVTVVPVNSVPVAVADGPFTVGQGGSLTLTYGQLLGNDVDPDVANGDVLSVNSVFASQGSVVNNVVARTVTYTPVANYTGPASFIYRVKDAAGAVSVNTAKVSVTVVAANPTAEGLPVAPLTIGATGTAYQVLGRGGLGAPTELAVMTLSPDGPVVENFAVASNGGFIVQTEVFTRPDGSIVVVAAENTPILHIISVDTSGTVTLEGTFTDTVGGFPVLVADDGTVYQVMATEKMFIGFRGETDTQRTFEVWRLTPDGDYSTHTYDLGSRQFSRYWDRSTEIEKVFQLGADGNLYVPFESVTYGTTSEGVEDSASDAALFVVPRTGSAYAIRVTDAVFGDFTTGSSVGDFGVADDGTAYLVAGTSFLIPSTIEGIEWEIVWTTTVLVVRPNGSVNEYVLDGGRYSSDVGPDGAYVVWDSNGSPALSVVGTTGSGTAIPLTIDGIDFGGVSEVASDGTRFISSDDSIVSISSSGVVVNEYIGTNTGNLWIGPDSTVYVYAYDGSDHRVVKVSAGTVQSVPLGGVGLPDNNQGDFVGLIKFASDGTPLIGVFDQVTQTAWITNLSTGVASSTIPAGSDFSGGQTNPYQFMVAGDIAYLSFSSENGTHVLAVGTDGDTVFSYDLSSGGQQGIMAAASPDGTAYIVFTEIVGGTNFVTHVWAADAGGSANVVTAAGLPAGVTVSSDGTVLATIVEYDFSGTVPSATTTVYTISGGTSSL